MALALVALVLPPSLGRASDNTATGYGALVNLTTGDLNVADGAYALLVAEQVATVDPDLVAHDAEGRIYTVRYEEVNAMLLNEFLKEHRRVEAQQGTIEELRANLAAQQKELRGLAALVRAQTAAPVGVMPPP